MFIFICKYLKLALHFVWVICRRVAPRGHLALAWTRISNWLTWGTFVEVQAPLQASNRIACVHDRQKRKFSVNACRASLFMHFLFLRGGGSLLGFEFRISHLLGRSSTTGATLPAIFCVGYFQDRFSQITLPGLALNQDTHDLCLPSL
jgi:hypothetical protein